MCYDLATKTILNFSIIKLFAKNCSEHNINLFKISTDFFLENLNKDHIIFCPCAFRSLTTHVYKGFFPGFSLPLRAECEVNCIMLHSQFVLFIIGLKQKKKVSYDEIIDFNNTCCRIKKNNGKKNLKKGKINVISWIACTFDIWSKTSGRGHVIKTLFLFLYIFN